MIGLILRLQMSLTHQPKVSISFSLSCCYNLMNQQNSPLNLNAMVFQCDWQNWKQTVCLQLLATLRYCIQQQEEISINSPPLHLVQYLMCSDLPILTRMVEIAHTTKIFHTLPSQVSDLSWLTTNDEPIKVKGIK
jgi:hypothetical protein